MISKLCIENIDKDFNKRVSLFLSYNEKEHINSIESCTLKTMVSFLYGNTPVSDIVNYPFELFMDYGKHGEFLYNENNMWGEIPEDIFLNYVLHHRVNEEHIVPCRKYFYDVIKKDLPNIFSLSVKDAVLCLNNWCAANVTYKSSDDRTLDPMTIYTSGIGRCGEESTFTVTALRSIGIPARQVYAPRWSHCDDNHAWVEVWCDGEWYFIGACEPEPILNKGWFPSAASRAMLIHSRKFGKHLGDENIISGNDALTEYNELSRYGKTTVITINIKDAKGNPAKNIPINLEILNYSEFFPIAVKCTDEKGVLEFETGLGSLHIYAKCELGFCDKVIDTREGNIINLFFEDELPKNKWIEFNMISPVDSQIHNEKPDIESKEQASKELLAAVNLRKKKEDSFYLVENANNCIENSKDPEFIQMVLKESRGNFAEIERFLAKNSGNENLVLKEKMLSVLTNKDYRDCNSCILKEHIKEAKQYKDLYDENIFDNYILNPRVYIEPITSYRSEILSIFTEEEKTIYRNNPIKLWNWISSEIIDYENYDYKALSIFPVVCITKKIGNDMSKNILFVAVCRSLGIPARLNTVHMIPEFYSNNKFVCVDAKYEKLNECKIRLGKTNWAYFKNITIAKLEKGSYKTMFFGEMFDKENCGSDVSIYLPCGEYRILTSNRLPNGNMFAYMYLFDVCDNKEVNIDLKMRDAKLADMLEEIKLPEFYTSDEVENVSEYQNVISHKDNLIVWLEESKEPTEHILNELYDLREKFDKLDIGIVFVVRSKEALLDPRIARGIDSFRNVVVRYDDFSENVNTLARRLYVDPEKLPLIIAAKGEYGVFAVSGYNVGTADLLLRIFEEDFYCE